MGTNSDVENKLTQGMSGDFVAAENLMFSEVLAPSEMGLPVTCRKDLVSVIAGKVFLKKENVADGYGVTARLIPVWNIKHQSDVGIISPFTKQHAGNGVAMALHASIPIEAVVKMMPGEVTIELKSPQQSISRGTSTEGLHGSVKPYIVRAPFFSVEPLSCAHDLKEIVSGAPLKTVSKQFHAPINAQFRLESDNEFVDFYSYWEKIRQNSPSSLPVTLPMVSSVRKSSFRIEFNPSLSELKEVSLKLRLYSKKASHLVKRISNPIDHVIKQEIQAIPSLKKVHELLTHGAPATIIKVEASIKEGYSTKKVQGYAVVGYKYVSSHHVKSAAAIAGKLDQTSNVYGILYEGELKRPKINARWNKEQVLNQPLELFYNGKIVYGWENDQHSQQKIVLKSKFIKTAEQIKSVQESDEFKKCNEVALAGRRLSPICIKIRHQAGSLDRAEMNLELPQMMQRSSILSTIEDFVKAKFFAHYKQIGPTPVTSPGQVILNVDVARAGDIANAFVKHGNTAYNLTSIRIPYAAQGLMPIRVRNPIGDGIEQFRTNSYSPASCRVEPSIISTFDNKTYAYKITDCEHVLLADGQKTFPVAVTARTVTGEQKMVKVLAGQAKVEVVPESSSMKVKIDGVEQACNPGKVIVKKDTQSHDVIVAIKQYHDGVFHIYAPEQMMHVLTDGKSIEVIAPQVLKNRAAGLCGDMNGEEVVDLSSPRKCIMKPKLVAIAFMLNKEVNDAHFAQCKSIKPEDLQEYKREEQECTKEEIVKTPILSIWERAQRMTTPSVAAHKVEKHLNKICISKEKLKCGGALGASGFTGMKKGKTVRYACVSAPSSKAESLKKRAMFGESLGVELNELATAYSKVERDPMNCARPVTKIKGYKPTGGLGCQPDEWHCKKSGMCIPLSYRCDDEFDCGEDMDGNNDDSDQQGCECHVHSMNARYECPNLINPVCSYGVCKESGANANRMGGRYESDAGGNGYGMGGSYGSGLGRVGYGSGSGRNGNGIGGEYGSSGAKKIQRGTLCSATG